MTRISGGPDKSSRSGLGRIFRSEQGLRAGWSLLLFFVVYGALTLLAQYLFATIPVLRNWSAAQPRGMITPVGQIAFTGLEFAILVVSVAFVGLFGGTRFSANGFSGPRGKAGRFLSGLLLGLFAAGGLMGLMAVLGGYRITGVALAQAEAIQAALLYAVGFLLVSAFEEFAFRGFLQATLGRSIGFWPAAVILSLAFGAMHLPHVGTQWIAVAVGVAFGLLASLALRRTGDLWLVFGIHGSFDWAITFVFSAPIAGQPASDHLLSAALNGPDWLTGGPAGPVGSVLAFPVFAIVAAILFLVRRPATSAS